VTDSEYLINVTDQPREENRRRWNSARCQWRRWTIRRGFQCQYGTWWRAEVTCADVIACSNTELITTERTQTTTCYMSTRCILAAETTCNVIINAGSWLSHINYEILAVIDELATNRCGMIQTQL